MEFIFPNIYVTLIIWILKQYNFLEIVLRYTKIKNCVRKGFELLTKAFEGNLLILKYLRKDTLIKILKLSSKLRLGYFTI